MGLFGDNFQHAHLARGVLVTARFSGQREAQAARSSLTATLSELAREVDELFSRQGGIGDGEQVARVYARAGLRNDIGWRQERPIAVRDADLVWELPAGAHPEDGETLLLSLGAEAVVVQEPGFDDDPWRAAPHPMSFALPDEESEAEAAEEDERAGPTAPRKRLLH